MGSVGVMEKPSPYQSIPLRRTNPFFSKSFRFPGVTFQARRASRLLLQLALSLRSWHGNLRHYPRNAATGSATSFTPWGSCNQTSDSTHPERLIGVHDYSVTMTYP